MFPGALEDQELGGAQLHRHIGKLEAHALELADLLPELHTIHGPLLGELERPLGATEAGRADLQAGSTQPVVGHLETPMNLAQDGALGHPTVIELENAVRVAAV